MRRLLLVTMAVSLSAAVLVRAADDLVTQRFSDYLESLRTQAGIPGLAATVVRAAEGNWERGFGQQDVEQSIFANPITPFHLDGTTQIVTSAIILRCVEEGRLSLDDRIDKYSPNSPEPAATIRQLLTHTSGIPASFSYRTERLDALAGAIVSCTGKSLRAATEALLEQVGMPDSIPGPDALSASGDFSGSTLDRFRSVFARLAKPYAVDSRGRSTPSQYAATTLTPASGLMSSVHDLARFDVALRRGDIVRSDTLGLAWTPPLDGNGQRLPHGLGWFVQSYNGERIVWQFGVSDNASSSMIISVPGRGMTLVMLANSQGLARPFSLASGDVTVSPFARLFLSVFIR